MEGAQKMQKAQGVLKNHEKKCSHQEKRQKKEKKEKDQADGNSSGLWLSRYPQGIVGRSEWFSPFSASPFGTNTSGARGPRELGRFNEGRPMLEQPKEWPRVRILEDCKHRSTYVGWHSSRIQTGAERTLRARSLPGCCPLGHEMLWEVPSATGSSTSRRAMPEPRGYQIHGRLVGYR